MKSVPMQAIHTHLAVLLSRYVSSISTLYCYLSGERMQIFTQKDPFPELTEQREVRRRIIGGSNLQWPDSSTGIASFDRIGLAIRPCLERMPINRPSMEHVARELKAILVPENDEDGHSNVYDQTLLDEGNRSDLQVRDTQDAADLRESLDAIHLDMPGVLTRYPSSHRTLLILLFSADAKRGTFFHQRASNRHIFN